MFPNYLNYRQESGFTCKNDEECFKLTLESIKSVKESLRIFTISLYVKKKTKRIVAGTIGVGAVGISILAMNKDLASNKSSVEIHWEVCNALNNKPQIERVLSVCGGESNNGQVLLAKSDGNPVTPSTNRGPINFPTPPSGGRPVHVPKYRVAPKTVNQGLGAGANPAGAGGGGENADFDEQCHVPKKQQSQESKTYEYDYQSNKKKQSAEQCELDENVKEGKIEILAKSNKDNQNKVIGILQKMGY